MIDYITLTIVLVITIAFCVPFVYSHRKKKKLEKGLVDEFMGKAHQYQLKISSYDLWRRSYMIGVDEKKSHLLYVKFQPDAQEHLVDLKTVKNIRVLKEEREVQSDEGKEKVVDKLWLSLVDSNTKSADIHLEFYNAAENMGLMGEPLLIQKWHNLLQDLLSAYKVAPNRPENRTAN